MSGARKSGTATAPPATPDGTYPRPAAWALVAALAVLYLAFGAFEIYDYDTPLHLATGRALVEDPSSAGRNIFSFTNPDYPWLNDKWLENVVVHLVHAASGAAGLVALRMALLTGLLFLTWTAMCAGRPAGRRPGEILVAGIALAVLPFVAYERFTLRPELFSLVFLAATLALVCRDRRTRGEWIGVGLLHVLWVNMHVYWIFGPVVIAMFLAGDVLESWWTGRKPAADIDPDDSRERAWNRVKMLGAALAGALVSPWPTGMFLNPIRSFLFARGEASMATIAELQSPFDPEAQFRLALGFFFAASGAVALVLALRPRRLRPAHLLLVAGLFALAALMRRAIGMFAVAAAVVVARQIGDSFPPPEPGEPVRPRARRMTAALLGLAALSLSASAYVATDRFYVADGSSRRTGFSFSRLTYPVGLADFLLDVRPPGRFFNDFTAGSYLAFRLYPDYRVFIAGNTFKYPPEFLARYFAIADGEGDYRDAAEAFDLDGFALFYASPEMMPLALRLLRDRDYAPLHFDDDSLFFLRRTPETQALIGRHEVNFTTVAERRAAETPATEPASPFAPPPYPRGELNRATLLHRVRALALAEVEYRRALAIRPDLDVARHGLGDVLLGQGQADEALELLEPLMRDTPDDPHLLRDVVHAHSARGSKAASDGDWASARQALETALSMMATVRMRDPEGNPMISLEANARFNLAYVLFQEERTGAQPDPGRAARIDTELDAALQLRPDDAALHYRSARIRAQQGRLAEALELLSFALEHGDPRLREDAPVDPSFRSLHDEPAFRRLVSR